MTMRCRRIYWESDNCDILFVHSKESIQEEKANGSRIIPHATLRINSKASALWLLPTSILNCFGGACSIRKSNP